MPQTVIKLCLNLGVQPKSGKFGGIRVFGVVILVVGLIGLVSSIGSVDAAGPSGVLIKIDGAIQPSVARFVSRATDEARKDGAQYIVIQVDTPGGLFSATRDIVGTLLDSQIPVIAYVYPLGARAASAGTFIVASAHIAAMANATNIGAASPVGSGGAELPETIKSKVTQDAAAFLRSIAEQRDRNSDALEKTVLNAVAYSATEALDNGIIDLIADDIPQLLRKLDGMSVTIGDRTVLLETEGNVLSEIDENPLERFLGFVGNPNVAFVLTTLGGLLILIEFFNPGIIVAGVFGVIMLVLAFVGFGDLPVNWVGLALIGGGLALFFFEMQAPGLGVFGLGGAVSFVLGAFLLFGGFSAPELAAPSFRVSIVTIIVVSGLLFGAMFLLFLTALQSRRINYRSSTDNLVGKIGTATSDLDPRGTVQIESERWTAISETGQPIFKGEQVIVAEVDGVTLKVFEESQVT